MGIEEEDGDYTETLEHCTETDEDGNEVVVACEMAAYTHANSPIGQRCIDCAQAMYQEMDEAGAGEGRRVQTNALRSRGSPSSSDEFTTQRNTSLGTPFTLRHDAPEADEDEEQEVDPMLWKVNSKSSIHVCNNEELIADLKDCKPRIVVDDDGFEVVLSRCGKAILRAKNQDGQEVNATVEEVFYNQDVSRSTLSISRLIETGWEVRRTKDATTLISPAGSRIAVDIEGAM